MKPGGDEPESVAPQGEAVPDLDAIRHQWPLGEAAGNILTQAEAFARELGGMPRITTTVLLFAIARTGIEERSVGMPDSAASRLLDLLGAEGETRLSAAMTRYRDANLRPAIKHAGITALTPGVVALFNRARALAQGHAASAERAAAIGEWIRQWGGGRELDPAQHAQALAARIEVERRFPKPLATVTDAANHLDHLIEVVGIDHVGISGDFDGGGGVLGCNDVSELPNLTAELLRRGYSEEDLRQIWGANLMRVLRAAERVAAAISAAEAARVAPVAPPSP